jgi:hypothetical protein
MNSANNRFGVSRPLTLALAVFLCAFVCLPHAKATEAQPAPAAGEATAPAAPDTTQQTSLTVDEAPAAETPSADKSDERPDPEAVLEMLRSGNDGKPLSVAQLATINDMLKRMEFIAQVEGKMREMTLGLPSGSISGSGTAGNSGFPQSGQPSGMPSGFQGGSGSNLTIVRIIGSGGQFAATLSNGTGLMTVREGDDTPLGRVARIGVNGVSVSSDTGLVTLPFSSSAAMAGVTFGR